MHKGTDGERVLQAEQSTEKKAKRFYEKQMKTVLNKKMQTFIEQ